LSKLQHNNHPQLDHNDDIGTVLQSCGVDASVVSLDQTIVNDAQILEPDSMVIDHPLHSENKIDDCSYATIKNEFYEDN
jgi:hypothetical protein